MKKAPPPTNEYYPTGIVGACSRCRLVGTLEFPLGFDFTAGDRVMERRTVRMYCLRCQEETEFIPRPDKAIAGIPGLEKLAEIERKVLEGQGVTPS